MKMARKLDFHFFSLVDGLEKELGYVALSELEAVRTLGLPIEQELHWQPKTLEEIAGDVPSRSEQGGA